jgi:putative transposase
VVSLCRTYRFLLQPTAQQRRVLEELRTAQRELYNAALEERRGAWRWERRSISRYEQFRSLTGWDHPVLRFGVTAARGTLTRLDEAFCHFHRRVRQGETPGFPRFKGAHRWDSVQWCDTSGWKVQGDARRLYLLGVGHVRFRPHKRVQAPPGSARRLVVRREGRRWWMVVSCRVEARPALEPTHRAVGIDLGVNTLVATSDGLLVANGRHAKRSANRLAIAQQDLARRKWRSARRRRAVDRVARLHRKVRNQRHAALHTLTRRLVNDYDVLVHEDLRIPNMTRRPKPRPGAGGEGYEPNGASAKAGLNRSIHDAGWGTLLRMLAYKAEEAGRQIIAVDPRDTSRRCPCGHVSAGNRRGAVFRCERCGHQAHADTNAAINILRAGLALREAHAEREAEQVA